MRPSGVVTSPSVSRIPRSSSRTAAVKGKSSSPSDLSYASSAGCAGATLLGEVSEGEHSPSELLNLPGVAGHEELRDVARSAVRDRATLLLDQNFLVRRRRPRRQHGDRDRELRRPQVGQQLARVEAGRVVDPQRALGYARGANIL